MNTSLKKTLIWVLMAAGIFSLFLYLFNLGVPGAALQFATGITFVIIGGMLAGRYASRFWSRTENKKINRIITMLVGLVLVSLFLMGFFVNKMIENTQFNYFFFTVFTLFLLSGFVALIISLIRQRIRNNIRASQTALAQSKTDLQLLQSQLSPHFLFNTLNNLYGLSLTEHQKVPGLLLKLSDLLRYSVYEAKEMFVPLDDEINYLRNYIEFEKIRLGERLSITAVLPGLNDATILIAPMLLIVFVENAFKHSKNNQDEKIFIEISLQADKHAILFSIKNSCVEKEGPPGVTKPHSGFGLESVTKRLNLLYHKMHKLSIIPTPRSYSVELILTLS